MAQQVQELIDKIKEEGIQAAEQQAVEIKKQATNDAERIIKEASNKADQLIVNAKEEVKKLQESTHMALKQAARDTILSLRKEIEAVLAKIVKTEVSSALNAELVGNLLEAAVKTALDNKVIEGDLHIGVNEKDLSKIKSGFLSKLQKQVKTKIHVAAAGDIGQGFTISFDGGKSNFDFTDQNLAEYLGTFLNSQIALLIKEAV